MGNKVKGFVEIWVIKLVAGLLLLAALSWGVHLYNDRLREQGRVEVRAEWTQASKAQQEAFDEERKRLTRERDSLSARYHTSEQARKIMERENGREREEAIAASDVASNTCYDERMRDNWNRDSGYAREDRPRPRVDGSVSGTVK